jgi:tripartite-type tricarboxylate transporter receptor subunit TctC
MTSHRSGLSRRIIAAAAVLAATAGLAGPVLAQDGFPAKPITIVVGYTAGGANDILARIVAEKMSVALKQPVLVENRPGVASIVGATFVAKARPDGYTLLMGASGPISFNPSLYKSLPYSPEKDLVPVSLVGTFPLVLLTQAANPDTATLKGLVQFAKAHPEKANYSASAASFQLISELFKRRSDTQFLYIPYKGSSESIIAVSAGDATMTLVDSGPAMPAVKGGRVRALAITAAERAPYLPDTPTMKELGIDMNVELWSGLFAPAGTPPAIVKKLEQAVHDAVAAPDVQQRITGLSITPVSSTSQELAARVKSEIRMWQEVATAAGIQPN